MVLDGAKGEKRETDNPDTREYDLFKLNDDMGDGDKWDGQPFLTDIFEGDYGKGAFLFINNHKNEEKLRGKLNINGKNKDGEVSFFQGSLGFDVINSIKKLNGEEVNGLNVWTINFDELKEYLNSLESITVKVHNHTSTKKNGDIINWNTFTVTKIGA